MSRGWINSGLEVGTELKMDKNLFQEPRDAVKRIVSCTYVGETPSGIIVDCKFKPAVGSKEPESYHYKININWANIYCGDVKICLKNGSRIVAKREKVKRIY